MALIDPATWLLFLGEEGVPATADPLTFVLAAPPPPAADLVEAAVAYLTARPELAAAFGTPLWCWGEEAPRRTPYPFAVLTSALEASSWASVDADGDVPYQDDLQLAVAVYATDKDLARSLGRLLESALDDAPLAFATGQLLLIRRASRSTAKGPGYGPGGVDAWQCALTFECSVARYE